MPEGKAFGLPRAFAQDSLDSSVVFTNPLAGGRITIPEWLRDARNINPGDELKVVVFPLHSGVLNMSSNREFKATVDQRDRFNVPAEVEKDLKLANGIGALVWIKDD